MLLSPCVFFYFKLFPIFGKSGTNVYKIPVIKFEDHQLTSFDRLVIYHPLI
jgi:hypothetical protein